MADRLTVAQRSALMARIKGTHTKPERMVFAWLRKCGIHFQRHYRRAPGSPDAARPKDKKALFIEGDFWHGWGYRARKDRMPEFWRNKIERNMRRDRKNHRALRRDGWELLRIWEHDLKGSFDGTLLRVVGFLDPRALSRAKDLLIQARKAERNPGKRDKKAKT